MDFLVLPEGGFLTRGRPYVLRVGSGLVTSIDQGEKGLNANLGYFLFLNYCRLPVNTEGKLESSVEANFLNTMPFWFPSLWCFLKWGVIFVRQNCDSRFWVAFGRNQVLGVPETDSSRKTE